MSFINPKPFCGNVHLIKSHFEQKNINSHKVLHWLSCSFCRWAFFFIQFAELQIHVALNFFFATNRLMTRELRSSWCFNKHENAAFLLLKFKFFFFIRIMISVLSLLTSHPRRVVDQKISNFMWNRSQLRSTIHGDFFLISSCYLLLVCCRLSTFTFSLTVSQ